jgi:hypothetical protein
MARETESDVDEYYVLFRDTDDPRPIDYKERCKWQDLLIGDRASFVWGYIGRLNDRQAELVKRGLDSTVNKRFSSEHRSSAIRLDDKEESSFMLYQRGEIRVIPRTPAALSFLAQVSPNLQFFSHIPLNQSVRIFPESIKEKQRILEALTSCESQENFGFELHYDPLKKDSLKRYRSFVELVSLETLMDMWQRTGCCVQGQLLKRTAGIWVVETLEKNIIDTSVMDFYKKLGKNVSPENMGEAFRSKVLHNKTYISTFSLRQLEVLEECVDIANIIKGESRKKNRYKVAKRKRLYKVINKNSIRIRNRVDPKVELLPAKEEKQKLTRRNTPSRIEDVKKIVETYWKKVINGELVTKKDVAKQKFPKETNILSKAIAIPFMKKISEQVKMAKAKYGSIRNFDNRTRAALLAYVHDILK